ncbi:MAG: hypothetical protein ACRD21_05750 [Vicinamibacteria bacterium]
MLITFIHIEKTPGMQGQWRRSAERRQPRAPYANLIAFIRGQLKENPNDVRLRQSLATHLGHAGRYCEAIEEAERLLKLAPRLFEVRRLLLSLKLHRLLRRGPSS